MESCLDPDGPAQVGSGRPHQGDPSPPRWIRWLPVAYLVAGLAWIFGSDQVLAWLFRDEPDALLFAGSLKGVLFVVVTAILFFLAVSARWQPVAAVPTEADRISDRHWQPIVLFLLAGASIAGGGYWLYWNQVTEVRAATAGKLAAVADLGSLQVSVWFQDQQRPLVAIGQSPFTGPAVDEWLRTGDAALGELLTQRLKAILTAHDYAAVRLFDADGRELLGVGEEIGANAILKAAIARAAASHGVQHTNLYRAPVRNGDRTVIDFAVGIDGDGDGGPADVAVFVARVHPEDFLGPVIAAGHAGFSSGETMLVRRAGDRMVFLTALRFGGDAAMDGGLPMSESQVAGVRLLQGERGPIEALDYRGVRVLAVARPVEGTDWLLGVKVDETEVRASLLRQFLLVTGLAVAALVAAGALVALWWRGERLRSSLRVTQAEARADALAQRFGWVNRHANDVILLFDTAGRILDANESAERVYGYSRSELLDLTAFDLRGPGAADLETARAQFASVRDAGALLFETRHRRRDGTTFPVEVSSGRVELDGESYVQSIVRDITDRVAAEQALRRSEERFRMLAEVSPVGIFRADAAGQCTYANARWCEIAGLDAAAALGDGWIRALHPEDAAFLAGQWRQAGSAGTQRAEFRLGRTGDGWTWVLGQILPERGLDGSVTGFVGTITDITDLKRAQVEIEEARKLLELRVAERTRELVAAKERAERADTVKSSFLSMMSHELRTPLNSILGFTDVILQRFSGPLTAEQERQLGIVRDSSMHLLALINDVLDISRIEAGQLRLEIGPVDLADLLRRRMQAFEAQASAKGLALECRIGEGVGVIRSDSKRIAQIVTNLLSNAVKFTEHGRVALDARLHGQEIEVEVSDTGHGIAADELPRLFTAFEQLATSGRGSKEGTGLGLAISRHLARALGGDIAVVSTPGEGSRFTLRLPPVAPSADDVGESGIFRRIRELPAPLS
jgi:PAS domain S-box-containing protein